MIAPNPTNRQNESNTDYAGVEELWANEKHMPAYNRDIVAKLSAGLPSGARVLEFGAGIGTMSGIWRERTGISPECVEIDAKLRALVESRGFQCHAAVGAVPGSFDWIYSSNVLEHVEDDAAALLHLHTLLKPGGVLALYVPAFPFLYSSLDAHFGHYRRYGREELMGKLRQAGFDVQKCHYTDCAGLFAWLTTRMRCGGDNKLASATSLRMYDRYIYPVSKAFDSLGVRYLFGKNLLALARKPV